jgi:arylsulfatase A-like enzyme
MINNLAHEPAFLQAPDYTIPAVTSTNKGNGPFALAKSYHVNAASLLLLGKFFTGLKACGVYDNTRIIIVSDHGINDFSDFPGNITLPNGECLEFYAALLMVKDFGASTHTAGDILTDDSFMTNADMPFLATEKLISNPVDPYTMRALPTEKDSGVTITTSQRFGWQQQSGNLFNIAPDAWLHVHDNIFNPANWEKVVK